MEDLEDTYAADEAEKNFEARVRKSRPIATLANELGLIKPDIAVGRALNIADGEPESARPLGNRHHCNV